MDGVIEGTPDGWNDGSLSEVKEGRELADGFEDGAKDGKKDGFEDGSKDGKKDG